MEINQAFVHDILVVEGRPQLFEKWERMDPASNRHCHPSCD
jgi:hypothetical protein